ncbi:hypothetical protein [Aeromonas phage AerS_266]|nr:hypothetical protein [Aeromonas phage AerS_266]
MKIKLGDKEIKLVFLKKEHLDLLKAYKLELKDILSLPSFKEVSDEDCLEWLEYQRSMEKQYCGFCNTTYDNPSDNPNGPINRQGTVYKAKYQSVLNTNQKTKPGKFCSYYMFNGLLFIMHSDNTVMSDKFTISQGNLSLSIYRAILNTVGSFGFYHKEEKLLTQTVRERGYIDAGFVLSKVVA